MATPNYIDANYRNQLKDELKESIFNALKGSEVNGSFDGSIDSTVNVPEVNEITMQTSFTPIDPLEPLRNQAEDLANIIDAYVTERIYLEILGSEIEDRKINVTGTVVDKLNNV